MTEIEIKTLSALYGAPQWFKMDDDDARTMNRIWWGDGPLKSFEHHEHLRRANILSDAERHWLSRLAWANREHLPALVVVAAALSGGMPG